MRELEKLLLNKWEIREKLGKNKSMVLDIGAYTGEATKIFLDMGCEVYAFESNLNAFECLKLNCPQSFNFHKLVGDGNVLDKSMKLDDMTFYGGFDFVRIAVGGNVPYVLEGGWKSFMTFHPIILAEVNRLALKKKGFKDESAVLERLPQWYKVSPAIFLENVGTDKKWYVLCIPDWGGLNSI